VKSIQSPSLHLNLLSFATLSHLSLQAFFAKWWQEQSEHVRDQVRALVASGQLQFVNGGLVQHDEATSHYSSIIDQMGIGMRYAGLMWG
jgi:hypothetical protein